MNSRSGWRRRFFRWTAALSWLAMAAGVPAREDDSGEAPLERIASVGGAINDWAEKGNYLYVGQGDSLRVYDQSDRAHPKPVAWAPLRYGSRKLVVVGDQLWIQEIGYNSPRYEDGNFCYDIAEPARPRAVEDAQETDEVEARLNDDSIKSRKLSVFEPLGYAKSVVAGDGRVWVKNDKSQWLMLDTTDPAKPRILGEVKLSGDDRPLALLGTLAYAAGKEPGLRVYDAARAGVCPLRSSVELKGPVKYLSIDGRMACVALGKDGLAALDVSDPARPRLIGAFATEFPCKSAIAKGNVVAIHAGDLFLLDASDPARMKQLGKVWVSNMMTTDTAPVVNPLAPESSLSDWSFDGRSIALQWGEGEYSTFLQWIDCRDPSNPVPIKPDDSDHYNRYDSILGNDGVLIARSYRHNTGESTTFLELYDQGDPAKPCYLGEWAHFSEIADYAACGDLIYVADGENGLVILRRKGAKK